LIGNFDLTTNSNLELAKNIFGLKYPTEDSTLESIEGKFCILWFTINTEYFGMESSQEDSIPKLILVDFIAGVIMINCVFMDKPTK
jgi:hypothetical protein